MAHCLVCDLTVLQGACNRDQGCYPYDIECFSRVEALQI